MMDITHLEPRILHLARMLGEVFLGFWDGLKIQSLT